VIRVEDYTPQANNGVVGFKNSYNGNVDRMATILRITLAFAMPIALFVPLCLGQETGSGDATLRQLATPIYGLDADELANGEHQVVDGAVFVFTVQVGTDREMLLSIECRKTETGFEWTYAPAAMTYLEIWMGQKGKKRWRVPGCFDDPRNHHYFTNIVDRIESPDEIVTRLETAAAPASGKRDWQGGVSDLVVARNRQRKSLTHRANRVWLSPKQRVFHLSE
jgi:hypothetical protein